MVSLWLFLIMYLFSFFMVMSGDDWFVVWIGLEVNMMTFILIMYRRYSMNSIESCLKYFFIQSLGSSLMISFFFLNSFLFSYVIIMIMSLSVGAGPFYYWFPNVCSGIDWSSCYLLMTSQKLIPLMLMMMYISWVYWMVVFMSIFMGAFGSFNQMNIKYLMGYSSIHQVGWIMLCMLFEENIWLLYLFMYSVVVFSVIFSLWKVGSMLLLSLGSFDLKITFMISIMSMAGMPPLLGFFLKWIMFMYLVSISFVLLFVMIMMSVIMFFVYMYMIYDMILYLYSYSSWFIDLSLNFYSILNDYYALLGLVMGLFLGLLMIL